MTAIVSVVPFGSGGEPVFFGTISDLCLATGGLDALETLFFGFPSFEGCIEADEGAASPLRAIRLPLSDEGLADMVYLPCFFA